MAEDTDDERDNIDIETDSGQIYCFFVDEIVSISRT